MERSLGEITPSALFSQLNPLARSYLTRKQPAKARRRIVGPFNVTDAGLLLLHLNPIYIIGTTDLKQERTSMQVICKDIHLRATFQNPNAAPYSARITVVYDQQPYVNLTVADIYPEDLYSHIPPHNRPRLIVLFDKIVQLSPVADDASTKTITLYKKLNLPSTWSSTSGVTMRLGKITLFAISTSPAGAPISIQATSSIRFVDF